ncbi:MAG: hypothetical protein Q7T82_20160 [Armatimonadota bacterium]|nr:hypothetical protein [Armatimonadota bacterium]
MARKVKHFSLHRIAGTELRVVSDVDAGILPVIQEEEAVIRGYVESGRWRHQSVTLFVLQDLQPLVHQLQSDAFPGRADVLDSRPVVNVYDLAEPSACHVFINLETMTREGYWDDPMSVRGLLAHEHAHPLAEGRTTQASRELTVETTAELPQSSGGRIGAVERPECSGWTEDRQAAIRQALNLLVHKLCLYAPREIFANETAIRSGFGDALLHLDRRNLASGQSSVAIRGDIKSHLQRELDRGELTPAAAKDLLLVGDLQGYIDLALEVAPFHRGGVESAAQELEATLENEIFRHLEPEARQTYVALVKRYIDLRSDLTRDELRVWGNGILDVLAGTLADKGIMSGFRIRAADTES